MEIVRHTRVDLGDRVLFDFSRKLKPGKVIKPDGGKVGVFRVKDGGATSLTFQQEGLVANVIPDSEVAGFIMSGGKKQVSATTRVLGDEEINGPGSQLHTRQEIGPFTVWNKLKKEG